MTLEPAEPIPFYWVIVNEDIYQPLSISILVRYVSH